MSLTNTNFQAPDAPSAEPKYRLGLRIEAGLKAHNLINQANNINQSLSGAEGNNLTETLAQNLVTAIFTHFKKDESVMTEYIPLLTKLGIAFPQLRMILQKSVTKRGRCPENAHPVIKLILNEISEDRLNRTKPALPTPAIISSLPSDAALVEEYEPPDTTSTSLAFNLNKLLGYSHNPLGSLDSVIPSAVRGYQSSLELLKRDLENNEIMNRSAVIYPKTISVLTAQIRNYRLKPDAERAKYFLRLARRYSQSGREELFKFALMHYCLATGRALFQSNRKKESRQYFQMALHFYHRSPELQGEFGSAIYDSLSYLCETYNLYLPVKEGVSSEVSERFYENLNRAFQEGDRQQQWQVLGGCLLDITLPFPRFVNDWITKLRQPSGTSVLNVIQNSLMVRKVFISEPLTCLTVLSRIELSNVSSVLSCTALVRPEERRLVATALLRFALDSVSSAHEILKGFAQQASSDTKADLAFAILVESLAANLLARGKEAKARLIAEILGFPYGNAGTEYFLGRVSEVAELFNQFSRTSDPNLKGRYGYSILETIRLTRKWSAERLRGDIKKDAIRFCRTVEGYVTTEQSKLIRDTTLEVYLASDRAVYSSDNTRVTFEIRNVGEGTADGLELEVFPVEGLYDVDERFRIYPIDILSDKTPIQKEVFIKPLVPENQSIELSAALRYNSLKEKKKHVELEKTSRSIWLYPETQFVRVPQPYNIGEPATTWFYGRHNLLENMADNLQAGAAHDVSMIVYGLKRAGKTSVVKRFMKHHSVQESGFDNAYIPIYADLLKDPRLQQITKDAEFLYFLISIIYEHLSRIGDIEPKFDLYRFKDEFNSNSFETFSFILEEMLTAVAPRRLLIALDEFSTLQSKLAKNSDGGTLSPALFGFISNTIQSTNQLTFIFTGTYMLLDMMREYTFDLAKICTPYMVGFLDDNAARQLVTEPVKRDPQQPERGWLEFDARVVDQIVNLTNRHPFLIQYLCMQLVNRMNQLKHNSVNLNDMASIIADVVSKPMHAPSMYSLWNEFDSPQHKVMSCIASREDPSQEWADIDELMHVFREFGDASSVDDVLAVCESLTDAELLIKSGGSEPESYRITIPLFQMWLKQNKPPRPTFLT